MGITDNELGYGIRITDNDSDYGIGITNNDTDDNCAADTLGSEPLKDIM